ncbi:DUF1295-domain-containing protein [Xylona heveae TC161]|uniref:DUF1295-domain-containing protein n=1 Tax=Xylona heveae (strain CBS 132557 / TC161) TaxID=1328760 RepID=A0A165I047_XYLHT|nr:DUF1295-domain-containing protein [Xylona heveae TC161]KZF24168.1 DUF1295-domain-containing protein [Xylona heveae TC161]
MASLSPLPVVKTVSDCADFSRTVLPYLPQLRELPSQIFHSIQDPQQLKEIYVSTNPLILAFAFSLFLSPLFLFSSQINKNYSQVDRFWSILPTLYNAHFVTWAHMVGLPTLRQDTLIAFSVVWSLRLTYNYWRKGGYSIGSEDYRWKIVQSWMSPSLFFLFNVVFISTFQSILLFLITTPTYVLLLASRVTGNENTTGDLVFSRVLMALILVEFFADQQQWAFQEAKKEYQKTAKVPRKFNQEDLDRGFVVSGLWSWSRHPNFAAEQAIWIILYQWGCYTTDTLFNWTVVGSIFYAFLFQGSTWLTESISAKKYPEYREYQKLVPKFIPKLLGSGDSLFSVPVESSTNTSTSTAATKAKEPKLVKNANAPKLKTRAASGTGNGSSSGSSKKE